MRVFLQKFRLFVQEETLYVLILSGLFVFHSISYIFITLHPSHSTLLSEAGDASTNTALSLDSEKIQELVAQDPGLQLLVGGFTLLAIVVLLGGLLLNLWFWIKQKSGGWHCPWRLLPLKPAWGLRDVFRVCTLLILIAYLVEIGQGLIFMISNFYPREEVRLMINTTFLDLVAVGMIVYWVSVRKRQSLRGLGFSTTHLGRNVFLGVSSYVALLPILLIALFLSVWVAELIQLKVPEQPLHDLFFGPSSPMVMGMAILLVVLVGPIVEETFFRGFLYGAMKNRWGKGWAMIASGTVFALLHANWAGFLPTI